jgi:hypothetical protein
MQRPLGITILAILAAIAGIFGLLGTLGLLAFGLGIFGLILLVLSVVYLVFAYGAWTLKPWAWTLGVALSVASIILTVIQLVQGLTNVFSALISIAISGVILYYLFQPDVKAAFGRT